MPLEEREKLIEWICRMIGLWFYSFKLKIPAIILGLMIVVSGFTIGLL